MHERKALENNRKSGLIAHDVLKNLSGLEIFQKMVAGELLMPPFAETLDYTLVEVERGRVVFGGHPKLAFSNPLGTIHGGYLATLLDSAMACAVHTTLEAGKGCTSLEFKINFVRPVFESTGFLRTEGNIINVGRQIATSEGKITDENGKLYAHGTTTLMIYDLK